MIKAPNKVVSNEIINLYKTNTHDNISDIEIYNFRVTLRLVQYLAKIKHKKYKTTLKITNLVFPHANSSCRNGCI